MDSSYVSFLFICLFVSCKCVLSALELQEMATDGCKLSVSFASNFDLI